MMVLKRFEFDYDTMQKIKLNDYCQFPMKLDMKPYTKEYLSSIAQNTQDQGRISEEIHFKPDDYYSYSLRGAVIHHGTSEAGHYYSYIKIGEDQWYEFNDEWIEKFDLKEMKKQAFGGE